MFPEAGQKLGPYEILGELGGGGMARVYRAWDARLHREVAIKVIDDRYAMPGIGERFLREARAASGLNHPNICTIFDIGEQDGAPYLVMELLEGETLKDRIGENPLPADEILRYAAEVSDALSAAHARGIIHRDIKPANIFLVKKPTGSNQAKVLDFGLAKIEQYASEERDFGAQLTTIGATVGTVSYMSPEQARGEKLDARSDLFSLGIVMYEMATGTLPFKGATSALVFVQLLGLKAPDPIRKLNGQIPDDLEQVIFKLLAKSARARFQSAAELCDVLHELAETRSGWLTRMKPPPAAPLPMLPVQPQPPVQLTDATLKSGEPANRQAPPGKADAARIRVAASERVAQDAVDRALPARPGDPQGVRGVARRRRDSSEQRRAESKKDVSKETPATQDAAGGRTSGMRPARTSIATNPKMSFPTVAPYSGQSGTNRAAVSADAELAAQGGMDATAPFGISREREANRSSAREATASPFKKEVQSNLKSPGTVDEDEMGLGGGISWTMVALVAFLILLVAGLAAWRFGFLGGALQTR